MSAHFIVTEFNGVERYAVEFFYTATRSDGGRRFPEPKAVIPIPESVAALPLQTLIDIYRKHNTKMVRVLLAYG